MGRDILAELMYDHDDVHRSLREYVSLALGSPPWRVRTERAEIRAEDRPAALVETASNLTTPRPPRSTVPQGSIVYGQTYAITAYPAVGDTPRASGRDARRVAHLLRSVIDRGLVVTALHPSPTLFPSAGLQPGRVRDVGAPGYVPVWDWEGVEVEGTAEERSLPAGREEPYCYALIGVGASVRTVQDQADHRLYSVVASVPLTYEWPGRDIPDAPLVRAMPGTPRLS